MTRTLALSRTACALLLAGGTLLGSSCKKGPGGVTGAAGSAMELLPREANIVFAFDLGHLRSSKAWDLIVKQVNSDAETQKKLADISKDCQFDPLRDLDDILVATSGSPASSQEFAVIVSGKNLVEKNLVECIKKQGSAKDMTTVDYGGEKLYESGGAGGILVFLDDKQLAVAGSEAWAKKVVDLHDHKGDAIDKNTELMAMVKKTKTDKVIWGAGILPPSVKEMAAAEGGGSDQALAKVKGIYGSLDFATGLVADLNALCMTPADAKSINDLLNSQMDTIKAGLAMLQLDMLANDVKFSHNGDTENVAVNVPQADLDKAVQTIQKMSGGGMGAGGQGPASSGAMAPPANR